MKNPGRAVGIFAFRVRIDHTHRFSESILHVHLVVCISAHGYGHIAQTAPVLNALRQRMPALRLTVVSAAPADKLKERIDGPFRHEPRALDFGFVMADAFRIDRQASAKAYRDFHRNWSQRVTDCAHWLRGLAADAVLSNIAYLPLAAARHAGIPAYGLGSLNWATLFDDVFGRAAWAEPIRREINDAYRAADAYLALTPGLAMPAGVEAHALGPVARLGEFKRAALDALLGCTAGERVVLIAFGGIETRLPLEKWPPTPGWRWLVPAAWRANHPQAHAFEPLGLDFTDLLASVDALIGKPGYGTFVEAACNGTPMLFARRPDWREQEVLIPWLLTHGVALEAAETDLSNANAAIAHLERLLAMPRGKVPKPEGAQAAAEWLAEKHRQQGGVIQQVQNSEVRKSVPDQPECG